jgi:hypothetical protein
MKYIFLTLLIFAVHQIVPMDQPTKTINAAQEHSTDTALDEIVTNISSTINKIYAPTSFFDRLSTQSKIDKDYCAILAILKQTYPTITFNKKLLDKLYAKNTHFAEAIDNFTQLTKQNFAKVTPATLNTINDPSTPQIIPFFNQIDLAIKEYIFARARDQITHSYTISIKPGADVIDFDISPETDTIAISTGSKQIPSKLRLWNLQTGNPSHTFEEENTVENLCFNAPGNQLATLVAIADRKRIKIWNTVSKQLLHTIDPYSDRIPHTLMYNDHATNYLLHAIYLTKITASISNNITETWLVNAQQCLPCGSSFLHPYNCQKLVVSKKPYVGYHPSLEAGLDALFFKESMLDVTKNNCCNVYLCEQAINKAQNTQSFHLIRNSNPFKQTTAYEQGMIKELAEAKIKQLQS